MSERNTPVHLRVVASNPEPKSRAQLPARPSERQLSFPYPEPSSVFLVYIDAFAPSDFTKMVADRAPKWIIDARAVPRLDKIAGSRSSAFGLFEKHHVSYIDLFGRLGIKSYRNADSNPVFWGAAMYELLKDSERKGPYLFLFDNEEAMKSADKILPETMQNIVGGTVQLSMIGR
jgi:hypothetical protein